MMENDQIDLIPKKSINKVIQNFMKCTGALILHVENALSASDLVYNTPKIKSNDDSDIDIVEHSIKEDPDNTNKYLETIKKCVLQLCLLFIEDNIFINCDTTFTKIDFYSCIDESTKSLVINYLTENVGYLIEHIGFIIIMFSEQTDRENAKDIRKSLSKIYKQILLIPLNPNLDETPHEFQNLNSSLWYAESVQNLSDKLTVLRTSLIKLKKAFKRRKVVVNRSNFLELTQKKRKNSDIDTSNAKKKKLSSPVLTLDIPLSPKKDFMNTKKEKNKDIANSETSKAEITILSDTETVKSKKKHKRKEEHKENGIMTIEDDTKPVKKKNKCKVNSKNNENGIIIVNNTEPIKKKRKRKINKENEEIIIESNIKSFKKRKEHIINPENMIIIVDNDKESIKKKMKHKINTEHKENGITVESDTELIKSKHKVIKKNRIMIVDNNKKPVKKKKKLKINTENKENGIISVESDTDLIKMKHKVNKENDIIIVDNNTKPIKNKNKLKINTENKENEIISVEGDTELIKIKHKVNNENGIITVDNNTKPVKKKKKHKINIENKENEIVTVESDTERIKKKYKVSKENEIIIVDSNMEPSKKKHNINTENKENQTTMVDAEPIKKKKKHKINKENAAIIVYSDTESVKKKRKHKINPENRVADTVIINSDADSVKRQKKKFRNQENTLHSQESVKNKKELGTQSEINRNEIILETSNTETNKGKYKNNKLNSPKKNRSKSESESSIISIGQLFTTHMEISDTVIFTNNNKSKEDITTQDVQQLDDFIVESNNTEDNVEHNISHEIFDALSRGELQVDDEDESVNVLDEITRENNLNQNEKYLYIQDLLREAKKKNDLSSEVKDKLEQLNIIIDWNIPFNHDIGTRLTAGLLPREIAVIRAIGFSEKKYNQDEDKTIKRNWENFCEVYDLDGDPFPFLKFQYAGKTILKYDERKKFIQYLGKGLPARTLPSIYKRFRLLFRNKGKLGRYSRQEDDLILLYCQKQNSSERRFAELANVLNRDRPAIERRYRILTQRYKRKVKWTIHVESVLVNKLLKAISSDNIEDLRHTKLTKEHYKLVAEAMKIPWEKVRTHWLKFLYTKLYASEPLYTGEIRMKLIKILIDSEITDWKKIDWDEVTKNFDGYTKEFLWGQMMLARYQCVPKELTNLGAALDHLKLYISRMEGKGCEAFPNKEIKRYKMFDGSLDTVE